MFMMSEPYLDNFRHIIITNMKCLLFAYHLNEIYSFSPYCSHSIRIHFMNVTIFNAYEKWSVRLRKFDVE